MVPSAIFGIALGLFSSFISPVASRATPSNEAKCVDPQGLQYAAYPNAATYDKPGSGYPSYNPVAIKTQQPILNGVTGAIGLQGNTSAAFMPYNNTNSISGSNFIMDHRGYIKAPATGNYYVTITAEDDAVDFWIGGLAYSGWTRRNSKMERTYDESLPHPPQKRFHLVKNRYHPIRFIFGQAGGPFNLAVSITDSAGNELLGSSSSLSEYIVQYSCKEEVAPPFQPYGSET